MSGLPTTEGRLELKGTGSHGAQAHPPVIELCSERLLSGPAELTHDLLRTTRTCN